MTPFLSATQFATRLSLRWRRQLLVAALALLYLVLLLGAGNPLARTLFVAHLGLFILWQPFVRADQHIAMPTLLLILGVVALASFSLNGWMLTLWITLLAGVVGGKVFLFETPWTKLFFLMALFWLVAMLLLLAMPAAVPPALDTGATVIAVGHMISPVVLVLMLLLPERREADGQAEVVDFVYSVVVVLLLAVLVLGSLALMLLMGHAYVEALLETLLGIGISLLFLGWVWNPHLGTAGVGTVFSRYLLSIGMPIEQWLHDLADLAQRQSDPDDFVAEACRDMVRSLPWVTGVAWGPASAESFGVCSGRCSDFSFETLSLRIYTRYPLSPSLAWHFNLLTQLIGEFRADKMRARELKRLSYVQAVHETGARLTHDVKNLLQTLRTLCTAAEGEGEQASPDLVALLRRQLPAIADRLGQTLDKLQAPRLDGEDSVAVGRWWDELRARYAVSDIRFTADEAFNVDARMPAGLFNHVVENLLANALAKRAGSPRLQIEAALHVRDDGVSVEVSDDGTPMPPAMAADLFRGPVPSETGMGIGLYQAARLLERSGYGVSLQENRPGRVSFRLAPTAA